MSRPQPSIDPKIADAPPLSDELTDYDYTMLIVYLRLLDAAAADADWRDVARIVLKVDPEQETERARQMYDTHLARARWMMKHGYRHLLRTPRQ
jgi:predicted secreted protein